MRLEDGRTGDWQTARPEVLPEESGWQGNCLGDWGSWDELLMSTWEDNYRQALEHTKGLGLYSVDNGMFWAEIYWDDSSLVADRGVGWGCSSQRGPGRRLLHSPGEKLWRLEPRQSQLPWAFPVCPSCLFLHFHAPIFSKRVGSRV